jgi:6-phosphogluconolactonase
MSSRWQSHPNAHSAAVACARRIVDLLGSAVAKEGRASLAVSGGSTPRLLFEEMAETDFRWEQVHLFWVDERCVPKDDSQSNYLLAEESFLRPVRFPEANVHRVRTELAPEAAARDYAEEIRQSLGDEPVFDVMHLGMGADGHTASLFPGGPLIDDRTGIAASVWVEKVKQNRITLLPGALLRARHVLFLVAGDDKAAALHEVLNGAYDPKLYPSQVVARNGHDVTWFLDQAAARLLDS